MKKTNRTLKPLLLSIEKIRALSPEALQHIVGGRALPCPDSNTPTALC